MRHILLAALGTLVMAGSAASEPSAPASPVSATPPTTVVTGTTVEGETVAQQGVKEADPLVCRSETPIGSKLPVKHCMRKSERDRQKRDSQETLQLIQRRSDGPVKTDGPFQ
jgi:hypothetical protein